MARYLLKLENPYLRFDAKKGRKTTGTIKRGNKTLNCWAPAEPTPSGKSCRKPKGTGPKQPKAVVTKKTKKVASKKADKPSTTDKVDPLKRAKLFIDLSKGSHPSRVKAAFRKTMGQLKAEPDRSKWGAILDEFYSLDIVKTVGVKEQSKAEAEAERKAEVEKKQRQARDKIRKNTGFDDQKVERVRRSVDIFTGDDYRKVRESERDGDPYQTDDGIEVIDELNDFLQSSPKARGKVHRGMSIPPDQLDKFLTMAESGYKLDAMSSFSRSKKVASGFLSPATGYSGGIPVLMTVDANGSGVDISQISQFPEEREVLVPRGTQYKAKEIRQKKFPDGDGYEIILEEVSKSRNDTEDLLGLDDLLVDVQEEIQRRRQDRFGDNDLSFISRI